MTTNLPKWIDENRTDGAYVDRVEAALKIAISQLQSIDAGWCEGNADDHQFCEKHIVNCSRNALKRIEELGGDGE